MDSRITDGAVIQGILNQPTDDFHTLIYFTGDRDTLTLPEEDQQVLSAHLNDGKNLFVTGQLIATELADQAFLADVLRCNYLRDSIRTPMIEGVADDDVFDDKSVLLLAGDGANNQRGRAAIEPVNDGIGCMFYQEKPDSFAAVRWEEENGAKGLFFAFGFEGIGGLQSNDRSEIINTILDWFETPRTDVEELSFSVPSVVTLNSIYPNPCNHNVLIEYSPLPHSDFRLKIYNQLGRDF